MAPKPAPRRPCEHAPNPVEFCLIGILRGTMEGERVTGEHCVPLLLYLS